MWFNSDNMNSQYTCTCGLTVNSQYTCTCSLTIIRIPNIHVHVHVV